MNTIIVNGHSSLSSKLGQGCLYISSSTNTFRKGMNRVIFPPVVVEETRLFSLGMVTSLEEGKL